MNAIKEHPAIILLRYSVVPLLLLIPVFTAIMPNRGDDLFLEPQFQAPGAALAIMTYSAVFRHEEKLNVCGKAVRLKRGVALRKDIQLPQSGLTAVTVENNPISALFRARRVSIFGSSPGDTHKILLSPKKARTLCNLTMGSYNPLFENRITFSAFKMLVMSAVSSNAAYGLLLLIPVWNKMSKILGKNIGDQVYGSFSIQAAELLPLLKPAAAVVAGFFALGWLIHFISSAAQNANFCLFSTRECIITLSGMITTRRKCIKKEKISGIEFRQNLFSMIFRLEWAAALVEGMRGRRDGTVTLVPADRINTPQQITEKLLGAKGAPVSVITPDKGGRRRYKTVPLIWIFILLVLFFKSGGGNTLLSQLIFFGIIVAVWWLLLRTAAARRTHFIIFCDSVSVCGCRGFSLYRQSIPRGKIETVKITQTPFQKAAGLCSIYVRARGVKKGVRCAHVSAGRVMSAAGRL